ncbi:CbiQ family ECF transporter T component [Microbacterium azadirachtae]|uniref:CbiQ family ECF transporter T component n=1 Tax=Microbacterium azadirachtae TaxID=582680 RepID=UPI00088E8042|nr:CbiQ family ECF transporter T component [Microbacterium azadirachtae]SDL23358.1 biotin transport system permease protein [Microbacterium azadirachtae]SEF53252.1 biotin transport system permease protein [Microbacterium azadirachtae]SEF53487.1 biotin transport system permease protein [Microbacterium azadirachtae]
MISLYRPGTGFLHRAPAGLKLALLAVVALGLSLLPVAPGMIVPVLLAVVAASALYPAAGLGVRALGSAWWRLRWLILIVGLALIVFSGIPAAIVSCGRLVALLLLAELFTRTTSMSALMTLITRILRPLRRLGVDAQAVALVLSLALTMVPVVGGFVRSVREAQDARGVRLGLRTALPILVRTMRHADEVGEALAARGLAS